MAISLLTSVNVELTPHPNSSYFDYLPTVNKAGQARQIVLVFTSDALNSPEYQKIIRWADNFFQGRNLSWQIYSGPTRLPDLEVLNLRRDLFNYCTAQMEMQTIEISDFHLRHASCYAYALARAKEPHWEDFFTYVPLSNLKNLPTLLVQWGYQPVDQGKKGDLILYLKEGVPTHMSYCINENLVESKMDPLVPNAHRHPIDLVPWKFGTQFAIYRKSRHLVQAQDPNLWHRFSRCFTLLFSH